MGLNVMYSSRRPASWPVFLYFTVYSSYGVRKPGRRLYYWGYASPEERAAHEGGMRGFRRVYYRVNVKPKGAL